MCISLRESALAFAIIVVIVIVLWIRNARYDHLLASVLFVVGLIQLAEVFYYLGYDPGRVGLSIYIILWLQPLVLAIAMYCYFRTPLTLFWLVLFIVVFVVALIYTGTFSVGKNSSNYLVWRRKPSSLSPETTISDRPFWSKNGGALLGNWGWLYLVGIFIPFLIVEYYSNWRDIGLWLVLATLVLTAIIVYFVYPKVSFPSLWCYAAVAVAAVAYLQGAFPEPCMK